MQFFKSLPLLLLFGSAFARVTLTKRSRADCLAKTVARLTEGDPQGLNTDVAICYHGSNSATKPNDGRTDKSSDRYGYYGHYKCDNVGLDCFWMKGYNSWRGYEDAGGDNIAMLINQRCVYNKHDITVNCGSL